MSRQSRSSDLLRGRRSFLGAALIASLLFASPAFAQSRPLDAPRAAGVVGERYDGYAVTRPGASPEIAALVARVDAERRALYEQRAKSEGTTAGAIGRIYAQQIMAAAPKGTWFLGENGTWTRK